MLWLTKKLLRNEGEALLALQKAAERLGLKPSTVRLVRLAIADHFETEAETLRNPAPAEAFSSSGAPTRAPEFAAPPVDGEQAPSTPVTHYPPARSDAGFELDTETWPSPC